MENIENQITELRKQRLKLLHPYSSSDNTELNVLGLNQTSSADQFLSSPQTSRSIKERVSNALEMNQLEVAVTILENLLPQVPTEEKYWYQLDAQNPDKVVLLKYVKATYDGICERYGIDEIDRKIKNLTKQLRTKEVQNVYE